MNFKPTARNGTLFISLVLLIILQQTERQSGLFRPSKQALRKSSKAPRKAIFLMQYQRTPNASGHLPNKLLNNRQLHAVIDTLLPSPVHIAQSKLKFSNDKVKKTYHYFKIKIPVMHCTLDCYETKILVVFLPFLIITVP